MSHNPSINDPGTSSLAFTRKYIVRDCSPNRDIQKAFSTKPGRKIGLPYFRLYEDGCEIRDDETILYYIGKNPKFMAVSTTSQWNPPKDL